jgi:hypothetical protein
VPPESDEARGRRPSRLPTLVVAANVDVDAVADVDDDDDAINDDDDEGVAGDDAARPALRTMCSEFVNKRVVFAVLSTSSASAPLLLLLLLLLLAIVDDWSLGRRGEVTATPCTAAWRAEPMLMPRARGTM